MKGQDDPFSDLPGLGDLPESTPPPNEWPELELRRDVISALGSSLQGDHTAAIASLTSWDRRLTECRTLHSWFEVRLRLIAAYLLAGDEKRGDALARQLESKAREARDWLTLRRLARLLDPSVPVSPIAPTGPILIGSSTLPAPTQAEAKPEPKPTEDVGESEPSRTRLSTPLESLLDALEARRDEGADDPAIKNAILDALLALGPDVATHPMDIARMLLLARDSCTDPARGPGVWDWAETIAVPFPREASVLSLLASLGDTLRGAENSRLADRIDPNRIESLVRQSLDLDPNDLNNFGRAAVHYYNAGRTSEAERCLARCVRLDRRTRKPRSGWPRSTATRIGPVMAWPSST